MPTENARPDRLPNIHPGEVLREEFMRPRNIGATALARAVHVPPGVIRAVIRGRRRLCPYLMAELGCFFGTEAEFWLGLQADYDAEQARRAQGEGGGAA